MMNAAAPMQHLGELNGKPCYWAEPGRFTKPGFYFWDGKKNVHVPLEAVKALEFYARHEHWMALAGDADEPQKLLIANGDTDATDGCAMAEKALSA